MLQSLVVSLREGVEAALIVGIVLGYLRKTGRESVRRFVYWGVLGAAAASLRRLNTVVVTVNITYTPSGGPSRTRSVRRSSPRPDRRQSARRASGSARSRSITAAKISSTP